MTVKADQLYDLASELRMASKAIGDYWFANIHKLSTAQRDALKAAENKLLRQATVLRLEAINLSLDEVDASVTRIKQATRQARSTIKGLRKVGDVIGLVARLVDLGGAIASGNAKGIASALQNLTL